MTAGELIAHTRTTGATENGVAVFLALVFCLALLPLNTGPLFYVDTGGHLAQGTSLLSEIHGLFDRSAVSKQPPGTASQTTETVVGSRSSVYAMFLATCAAILGVWPVGLFQSLLLVIGIAMPLMCAVAALSG